MGEKVYGGTFSMGEIVWWKWHGGNVMGENVDGETVTHCFLGILKNIFGQDILGRRYFWPKIFWAEDILGRRYFGPKIFWTEDILGQRYFRSKIFWVQDILGR